MKKLVATIPIAYACILCIPSSAQFNKYHPFPDSNAFWCETSWWSENYIWTCYYNYDYYVNGDTLVNGKIYFKVHSSGGFDWGTGPYCSNGWESSDKLICLLREDTLNRKVYISPSLSGKDDTLLYDFNLKVGDMLKTYIDSPEDSNYIYSIDSILVGVSHRKQFIVAGMHIYSSPYDSIIEGIGSAQGLIDRIVPMPAHNWTGSNLNCFINDNMDFNYGNAINGSCQIFYLGVSPVKSISRFSVSPNPNRGIFTIAGLEDNACKIEIYNVYGQRMLLSLLPPSGGSASFSYSINLSVQPSGVYFYRVIDENGGLAGSGKLVIER